MPAPVSRSRALASAFFWTLLWATPAISQEAPADGAMTLAQAEHLAAGLRQGMTVDDVQKLLGKPVQTALKSDGGAPNTPSKGTLQWSYAWGDANARGLLRVDFTAQNLEAYRVNSWQWANN